MQIIVRATEAQQKEWLSTGSREGHDIVYIGTAAFDAEHAGADALIDLLYEEQPGSLPAGPLLILSSVAQTLEALPPGAVRINGWPTMLGSLIEAAGAVAQQQKAEAVLQVFNKQLAWTTDKPGFISARVVAMIVNEAFIALAEGVSTRDAINTAMKLGTNYPYGPFEWAALIGEEKIRHLLAALAKQQPHYTPASHL